MRDDSLWYEIHESFLGGPLRPPWADNASPPVPSPATVGKTRAWIMNEEEERPGTIPNLISDQCAKALVRDAFLDSEDGDGDGKEPTLTWRTSVMCKVREVAPCFSFLRRPPRLDPFEARRGKTIKLMEWNKQAHALIRAVMLGCVHVVDAMRPFLSVPDDYYILNWNRIIGYACEGRSLEIVKVNMNVIHPINYSLTRCGMNAQMAVNHVDFSSHYFASFGELLEKAASTGDMEIVRYLQQQIQSHPDQPVLVYLSPIANACGVLSKTFYWISYSPPHLIFSFDAGWTPSCG